MPGHVGPTGRRSFIAPTVGCISVLIVWVVRVPLRRLKESRRIVRDRPSVPPAPVRRWSIAVGTCLVAVDEWS